MSVIAQWKAAKKKENEEKPSVTTKQGTATTSTKISTPTVNKTSGGSIISQWKTAKKMETVQGWAEESINLLNDVGNYYSKWHESKGDAYTSYQDRASALLASADSWRKQYAGNDEAISYINEVVKALCDTKNYAMERRDEYSKWDSEETYIKGAAENWKERQERYENNITQIDYLKDLCDDALTIDLWYQDYQEGRNTDSEEETKRLLALYEECKKHGSVADIKAEIGRLETENSMYEQGENGWAKKENDDQHLWYQKYSDMSISQIQDVLSTMETGAEKNWLTSFAFSTMTQDDHDANIARLAVEVANSKKMLEEYKKLDKASKHLENDSEEYKQTISRMNEILKLYDQEGEDGIEDYISQKEKEFTLAHRARDKYMLIGITDPENENYNPEVYKNCGYISTATSDGSPGESDTGYADIDYEFINGNEEISEMTVGLEKNYYYINDKERMVYNYYHLLDRENGTNLAQRYLDLIQEDLNERASVEEFAKYEGNTVGEWLYGIKSGVSNVGTSIDYWYRQKEGYIPATTTQLTSAKIREDLEDVSVPLWYNFKTGKWEDKILGNSLGQIVYDGVNTTSQMLPSIIASSMVSAVNPLLGAALGNVIQGAYSGGNAYIQKINQGYTQGQANAYGCLIGASEAVLQALLGGIDKLGGKTAKVIFANLNKVDDVFSRFATSAGAKLLINGLSEGSEEMLQSFIEPYLAQAITGEEVSHDWEETLYNGLMGFVTGSLFEAVNKTDVDIAEQSGNAVKDSQSLKQEVIAQDPAVLTQQILELGYDEAQAQQITDAVAAALGGKPVTAEQAALLNEIIQDDLLLDTITGAINADNMFADDAGVAEADTLQGFDREQFEIQDSENTTTEDGRKGIAEKALGAVDPRTLTTKQRAAVQNYQTQQNREQGFENLLQQEQDTLRQLQQNGGSVYDIQKTQNNIRTLEQKMAEVRKALGKQEQNPVLRKLTSALEAQNAQNVEKSQEKTLENNRTYDRISSDSDLVANSGLKEALQEREREYAEERELPAETLKEKRVRIVKLNYKWGKKIEDALCSVYENILDKMQRQVTIQVNGTKIRVRVDAIGYVTDENGNEALKILEFKSSETAKLTKNQKEGLAVLAREGGVVVGGKKGSGSYQAGFVIPPGTVVEIIRLDAGGDIYVSNRYG